MLWGRIKQERQMGTIQSVWGGEEFLYIGWQGGLTQSSDMWVETWRERGKQGSWRSGREPCERNRPLPSCFLRVAPERLHCALFLLPNSSSVVKDEFSLSHFFLQNPDLLFQGKNNQYYSNHFPNLLLRDHSYQDLKSHFMLTVWAFVT